MRHNHYLFIFLGAFFLLCISSILLSLYVDPYRVRFSQAKHDIYNYFGGTRTAKAIHIQEGGYDAFILGSSRSEIGIDPTHALWGRLNTYNASLAGSNFVETYKVFQTVIQQKHPKLIVLALDYSLFSGARSTSGDFNLSRFDNSNSYFSSLFKEHLSKDSIEKSFRALKYSIRGLPPKHDQGQKNGHLTFDKVINKTGQHRLVFNTLYKKVITNNEAYTQEGFSSSRLKLLRDLVKYCSDQKIQLIIFISPVHALQLMTFKQIGIWEDFLNWKKELSNISDAYPETPVYDFTDFSAFISEEIPSSSSNTTMQWFWETSHYKNTLGNLILNRILTLDGGNLSKPFGSKLNHKNIHSELARQRLNLDLYEQKHEALLKHVKALVKDSK